MKKAKLLILVLLVQAIPYGMAQPANTPSPDIRAFVTQTYRHGLPYNQAKDYGRAAIPQLVNMLKDKSLQDYWQNIVLTLGYIGDPAAAKPLIQFLERQQGEVSVQCFRATLSVFYALGHIAQSGNPLALQTLKEYNSLDTWKTKNLNFSYARYKNEVLSEALSRQAIQGLGVSGQPEALEVLRTMKNQKDLRADWQDNVAEAIEINEEIKAKSAQKVFGKGQ
jgi:HEAT repeat protein